MASFFTNSLAKSILILVAITFYINSGTSAARNLKYDSTPQKTSVEFIRSSCGTTTYPNLCYTSLSVRSTQIQTSPKLLTTAALDVTLTSAKSTSAMMLKLSRTPGISARQAGAMRDCVEELGDSVGALSRSIDEMSSTKEYSSNFRLMINDVQTWVSAAMTDETTCSDGFEGNNMNGSVKVAVTEQIVKITHLTSNALALINHYATLHG